eukprot:Protomagalhaensia_sp_Gyna_25__1273@NODE_1638_length_1670_cov_1445_649908_g1283_i1_p2_GENE_NODE_1638_length_1670_cov_1445_649908_g1283_i1NODE_1638_length_1670_cov_1445_649908_g1283_i1_p2_ORF_typecomplete_len104_score4_92DUF515/PF04415_12/0_18_NODE_1638_length_1670_cov_1445_649908_g1283_i18221133
MGWTPRNGALPPINTHSAAMPLLAAKLLVGSFERTARKVMSYLNSYGTETSQFERTTTDLTAGYFLLSSVYVNRFDQYSFSLLGGGCVYEWIWRESHMTIHYV